MGAGRELGEQLGILEYLFSLGGLKRRDHTSGQEIHGWQGHNTSRGLLFQGQGLSQAVNEGQELGGVQVKDRHGLAVEAVTRIIATQYQQVEKAVSVAFEELAFSHIPVLVLEGKVDQGGKAHGLDIKPQGCGGECGMASGIVSYGQCLDPAIFFGLFSKTEDAFQSFSTGATAWHQLKGDGEFLALEE